MGAAVALVGEAVALALVGAAVTADRFMRSYIRKGVEECSFCYSSMIYSYYWE